VIAWYGIALRSMKFLPTLTKKTVVDGYDCLLLPGAYDGGGYHMWDVTKQQVISFNKGSKFKCINHNYTHIDSSFLAI
jgi:hypothetical protein